MESPASDNNNGKTQVAVQSRSGVFFMAQVGLRTIALASSMVAACVILTSGMTVLVYGIPFQARYTYSSANRFLLGVDCTVCGLSALSLLSLHLLRGVVKYHVLLFLHDLVVMVLTIAGCAAATAIGLVAKFGEQKMGWIAVCDQVPRFCNRIVIALALSYVVFFCYLLLCLASVNTLVRVSNTLAHH